MPQVESLPESHLGTKEHWDQVYEFGEDSVERMVRHLVEWMEETHSEKMPYVLDLGTGNGHLLFSLLEALEDRPDDLVDPSRLCGIDYSAASIALSRTIGSKRSDGCEKILFETVDLRDAHQVAQLKSKANDGLGWDIVCDKGTEELDLK
ncbi:N-acetylphosphatidylethanolamine-hydrolyzing phospholipase D [Malassezia nana]|uniref:N-acetylphosphatidylethanolamine-hydrolyzing phospholipase D n=1 Tax=Malassezia nana TaxID=180528 RepID=A0AAF0J444_9BASI|nr:N-acetylphosphatidylethanolamine-hydrolyzing phospholipase D [Malassezia nana]